MNEERCYTDIEILTDSINTLGSLCIPVDLIDSIGQSISRVKHNLSVLLEALQRNVMQQADAPVLELAPVQDPEQDMPEVEVEEINGEGE